jgi:hypothetical protein
MALPTKDKPKIKYIAKSRKGLPIFAKVKTWFEQDNQHKWNQFQAWEDWRPDEEKSNT